MNTILPALQAINFNELDAKSLSNTTLTAQDLQNLNQLNQHTKNYLDSRPYQLACIAKAMQVALQDEDIGSFDKQSILSMAYFFEDEMNALSNVFSLRERVLFNLEESGNQRFNNLNSGAEQ